MRRLFATRRQRLAWREDHGGTTQSAASVGDTAPPPLILAGASRPGSEQPSSEQQPESFIAVRKQDSDMRSIVDLLFVVSLFLPPAVIIGGALMLAWPHRSPVRVRQQAPA